MVPRIRSCELCADYGIIKCTESCKYLAVTLTSDELMWKLKIRFEKRELK